MGTKQIVLADSLIGENYVVLEKHGPYIRVSNSQEDHVEDGLKFWWRSTSPEDIKTKTEETANDGTILHNYFLGVLKGEVVDVQEERHKAPVEQFKKFVLAYSLQPKFLEHKMVSNGLGLGGQVDYIGLANINSVGEAYSSPFLWILDWKTGGVYQSQAVQLAFYAAMYFENYKEWVQNLAIVNVQRDGSEPTIHVIEKPLAALRAGLCTFERWKFDNARKLDWVNAPDEVIAARKKTKGKNRIKFDESQWKPEYQWPWVNQDSLEWLNSLVKQLEYEERAKE